MYFSERHQKIVSILHEKKSASVHYLAAALHVSEPTIRRDLTYLEEKSFIHRTFGGAVISQLTTTEIPFQLREHTNSEAKEIIAKKACKHIANDMVIFIDSSSTASKILKHLTNYSGLTVITNSPQCSLKLAELGIRSFCTGGYMKDDSYTYVGPYAEYFLRNFNADILFLSSRGVSEDGILSHSSVEESNMRRVMIQQSKKRVLLCTSDKIGLSYMCNICTLGEIDDIVTDGDTPEYLKKHLRTKVK